IYRDAPGANNREYYSEKAYKDHYIEHAFYEQLVLVAFYALLTLRRRRGGSVAGGNLSLDVAQALAVEAIAAQDEVGGEGGEGGDAADEQAHGPQGSRRLLGVENGGGRGD